MICVHELAERETAVADGWCPLCLAHLHVEDRQRSDALEAALRKIVDGGEPNVDR